MPSAPSPGGSVRGRGGFGAFGRRATDARAAAVHFWAPTFKWGISLANIADFQRPVDQVSTEQQMAVTATGFIWARFATQIRPVNYNLMTVNIFMGFTGAYQLYRKWAAGQLYGGGPGALPVAAAGGGGEGDPPGAAA